MTGIAHDLTAFVQGTSNPFLIFVGIVLASFILEDAAAVIAALVVADGHVSMPLALFSLFCGIALGDLGLFWLGRFAARHPWARRWIKTDRAQGMQNWLSNRLFTAVVSVRFVPGARLPTYTACGFLGMPFMRFAFAVVLATIIWTSFLFTFALGAGKVIMTYFGAWRWPAAIALVVILVVIGQILARRQARRMREKEGK